MSNVTLHPIVAPVVKESTSTQFLYADALTIAQRFVKFLAPHCTRIIIAGSLRRKKQLVSDIEILFVPKTIEVPDNGDFFAAPKQVPATDPAIEALIAAGIIAKRPKSNGTFTWGPENKLAVHIDTGIPVDFFATTEEKWWNALVVRTGPKDSNKRIASAALAMGWQWHAYGSGFTRGEGKSSIDRFVAKTERDVFEHVGLPYLEPKDR